MVNKRVKKMSDDEKQTLEDEGLTLLKEFAAIMGTDEDEETFLPIIQAHYDWAKKFICLNKPGYLKYVNTYVQDKATRAAVDSVKPGLALYIHQLVTKNLGKFKQ